MAEYICREAIIDDLEKEIEAGNVALDEDVWINKGLRIAIRDIKDIKTADVQPVDRWISFKDKQPQEGGFYLTYYAEHIRVSQWFPSKNWYNEHGGNVTNMVEYWQPLPEPPKQ